MIYVTLEISTMVYSIIINSSIVYSLIVYNAIVYSTIVYDAIVYCSMVYITIAYRSAFLSLSLCQSLHAFYKAIALVYTCFYICFVIYWHIIGDNRHWIKVNVQKVCLISWVIKNVLVNISQSFFVYFYILWV